MCRGTGLLVDRKLWPLPDQPNEYHPAVRPVAYGCLYVHNEELSSTMEKIATAKGLSKGLLVAFFFFK